VSTTSQTLSRPPAQRDVLVRSPKRNSQYDAKKGWNRAAQAVEAESSNSLSKVFKAYKAARELPEPAAPQPFERTRSVKTVWAGGIPDVTAHERGDVELTRAFADCGTVLSVQVRRKDGNRSWAFVSFLDDRSVSVALQKPVKVPGDGGQLVALEVKKAKVAQYTDGQMKAQWESQERKLY
jgi:hypothetical protein